MALKDANHEMNYHCNLLFRWVIFLTFTDARHRYGFVINQKPEQISAGDKYLNLVYDSIQNY